MTDEQEAALKAFDDARTRIMSRQKDGDKSVELVYGRAYQLLVRLGLRPQLKEKYRSLIK